MEGCWQSVPSLGAYTLSPQRGAQPLHCWARPTRSAMHLKLKSGAEPQPHRAGVKPFFKRNLY